MALKIQRKDIDLTKNIAKLATGGNVQYRISLGAAAILTAFGGLCDLVSLIPFVGDLVGFIFWIIAGIYLWRKGIGLFSGRKLATLLVTETIKIIPILQELPSLTVGIVLVIVMTRIEDKTGFSLNPLKKQKVTPPRNQRSPANQTPGVRLPNNQKNIEVEEENNDDFHSNLY